VLLPSAKNLSFFDLGPHFFDEDFFFEDFFFGTLPPSFRASDSPIAIACFLLVTFLPEPLFSVPFLRSCIAFSTFFCAFLPYLAMVILLPFETRYLKFVHGIGVGLGAGSGSGTGVAVPLGDGLGDALGLEVGAGVGLGVGVA
jgi:hypothetical protein